MPIKNIEPFIEYCKINLPPVESSYKVDYDLSSYNGEDKAKIILQLAELNEHIGNDFSDILLYDKIIVQPENVQLIGQRMDTVRIKHDGITYIQFRQKKFIAPKSEIEIEIVGTPNINEWNGEYTPQLFVKSIEMTEIQKQDDPYSFL